MAPAGQNQGPTLPLSLDKRTMAYLSRTHRVASCALLQLRLQLHRTYRDLGTRLLHDAACRVDLPASAMARGAYRRDDRRSQPARSFSSFAVWLICSCLERDSSTRHLPSGQVSRAGWISAAAMGSCDGWRLLLRPGISLGTASATASADPDRRGAYPCICLAAMAQHLRQSRALVAPALHAVHRDVISELH